MANSVNFASYSNANCTAQCGNFFCNQMGNVARAALAVCAFVLSVVLGLIDVAIISVIICAVIIISLIINVIIIRRTNFSKAVPTPTAS